MAGVGNYGTLQGAIDQFQAILQRTDCDQNLAMIFLAQGMNRVQRVLTLPSQERTLSITATGAMPFFVIPQDMIKPIDILWKRPDGYWRPLEKKSYRQLQLINPLIDPCAYARLNNQYWIAGCPQPGAQLMFNYYGNYAPLPSLASSNELLASNQDLAVYSALSYAGAAFQHPSTQDWRNTFTEIAAEVTQAAEDVDAEGGPVVQERLYQEDWSL